MIKSGQLKSTQHHQVMQGVGRKIILNYKSDKNSNQKEVIVQFIERHCFIEEG